MDLIKNLIGDELPGLISGVVERAGLDHGQAERFVPEAAGSVVEAARELGTDLDPSNPGDAVRSLVGKIDIAGLAGRTGLDTETATAGLGALAPQMLSLIESKAGGVAGLLSMLGGDKSGLGGMLGGLGKMFGK